MDPDDPYSDRGVLHNKLGITDTRELDGEEKALSLLRAVELSRGDVDLGDALDLDHLKAIHAHLFGDVYDWAGETRDVRAWSPTKEERLLGGQSVSYPPFDGDTPDNHLMTRLGYAIDTLAKDKAVFDPATGTSRFVNRLAYHVTEIWECHAFREGNSRTTAVFAMAIARRAGRPFERSLIRQDGSWRDTLVVAAARSEYGPLQALIADGLRMRETDRATDRSGAVVEMDAKLAADVERAHSTIAQAADCHLERLRHSDRESIAEMERRVLALKEKLQRHLDDRASHERDRMSKQIDAVQSVIRSRQHQFEEKDEGRRKEAVARAKKDHVTEAALLKRAEAIESVGRRHRELVAFGEERANESDPHERLYLDRSIHALASEIGEKAEYRLALDPTARRFVQYARSRSAQALTRQREQGRGHSD